MIVPATSLVIIPTYNERENLEPMAEAVLRSLPDTDLLVVDDRSPDGTGDLADRLAAQSPRITVLHRPRKEGLGPAYVAGFAWALARPYEAIVEMDCDFSHDPADLPRLVAATRDGADLAIGSRYIPGAQIVDWPPHRHLLSAAANGYARLVLGGAVRDWTSGFKCFRRRALEAVVEGLAPANGYIFQVQGTYRVVRRGLRVAELPIVFRERTRGVSKVRYNSAIEACLKVLELRWRG